MVGCRGLPEPDAHSRWVLSCAVARLGWRKHSFGKRHRGADGALRTPGPTGDTTDDKFYTISNVQADQTITPAWTALKKYTIVYSVVDH